MGRMGPMNMVQGGTWINSEAAGASDYILND